MGTIEDCCELPQGSNGSLPPKVDVGPRNSGNQLRWSVLGHERRIRSAAMMSARTSIALASVRQETGRCGPKNRPSPALSEEQEIHVKFNGELPAGRAEIL
jgi:hypothetical protein